VKVLAIGPSKQEVLVGGPNSKSCLFTSCFLVLKLLKIEPDLSIKQEVVRNIGNKK